MVVQNILSGTCNSLRQLLRLCPDPVDPKGILFRQTCAAPQKVCGHLRLIHCLQVIRNIQHIIPVFRCFCYRNQIIDLPVLDDLGVQQQMITFKFFFQAFQQHFIHLAESLCYLHKYFK